MGTADKRARADTGRLRSALAVPAVERNRDKCRSQLLQAVGGYRCDIYGNHVSLRLPPFFPITNARPVCAVRRATTSQAKVNSMNALLLSPHIPSTGRGSLTTSAAISLRSRGSRPRRRLSLKSWRIFRTPRRDSDSPSAGAFSICFDEQPQSRFGSPKYPQAHPSLGTIELFCDACIPRQSRLRATLRLRRQLGKP